MTLLRIFTFDLNAEIFRTVGFIQNGEVVEGDPEGVNEIIQPYSVGDDPQQIQEYLDGPWHLAEEVPHEKLTEYRESSKI